MSASSDARRGGRKLGLWGAVAAIALYVLAQQLGVEPADLGALPGVASFSEAEAEAPAEQRVRGDRDANSDGIAQAYASRRSGFMTTASGRISKVLSDDREGSRHQRFIVELPDGHTVLVAHNIDLATRVPLSRGDRVEVRGQYEWNEHGGVLHWTHRDPEGRHDEGWIRHAGRTYE